MKQYNEVFELILNGTWTINDFSKWLNEFSTQSYVEGYRQCDEDGPGLELADGGTSWYLNDQRLSETEFNKRSRKEVLTFDRLLTLRRAAR